LAAAGAAVLVDVLFELVFFELPQPATTRRAAQAEARTAI
jgi:hypothetical protein